MHVRSEKLHKSVFENEAWRLADLPNKGVKTYECTKYYTRAGSLYIVHRK